MRRYLYIVSRYFVCFLSLVFTLLLPAALFAQGVGPPPCDINDDPNGNCPLDSGVIFMVIAALTFVSYQMIKTQKESKLRQ